MNVHQLKINECFNDQIDSLSMCTKKNRMLTINEHGHNKYIFKS